MPEYSVGSADSACRLTAAAIRERMGGAPLLVSLEGRCAAGKSTLAAALVGEFGCEVIPMDDFFLPPELRSPERYARPGGNVHYERFAREVLGPWSRGETVEYRVFSCAAGRYTGVRRVPPALLLVVEGSYSRHPFFGQPYGLRVFLTLSPAEQQRRILARNGAAGWPDFRDRWIPLEEAYLAAWPIRRESELVLCAEDAPPARRG